MMAASLLLPLASSADATRVEQDRITSNTTSPAAISLTTSALLVTLLGVAGCAPASVSHNAAVRPPLPRPVEPTTVTEIDARFVQTVRTAAASYQTWGRVDDRPRVAPALCAAFGGTSREPGQVRLSAAEVGPHGKKLYFLWASGRAAYLDGNQFPVGFTVVKQSYVAVPGAPSGTSMGPDGAIGSLLTDTGQRLSIGAPKDLFVMTKISATETTEGTDGGWIYGLRQVGVEPG